MKLGPKVSPLRPSEAHRTTSGATPLETSTPLPVDHGARPTLDPPAAGRAMPDARSVGQSRFERRVEALHAELQKGPGARRAAGQQIIALARHFEGRRSRGARRRTKALCRAAQQAVPELEEDGNEALFCLDLDGLLREMTGEDTLRALDQIAKGPPSTHGLREALVSQALGQLVVHFPKERRALKLGAEDILRQAFGAAESSLDKTADLPDGYTNLARLLYLNPDEEARQDASELLRLALERDPFHDPADLLRAQLALDDHQTTEALAIVDDVLRRGNSHPDAWMLRAIVLHRSGDVESAHRDAERAVYLAPRAGLVRWAAGYLAERAGRTDRAKAHRSASKAALGEAFDEVGPEFLGL